MTKQGILSTVGSIFNPLGFLAPFILKAKLLIHLAWCKKLEWDEKIPVELKKFGKYDYQRVWNYHVTITKHYIFFVMHLKQHTRQLVI